VPYPRIGASDALAPFQGVVPLIDLALALQQSGDTARSQGLGFVLADAGRYAPSEVQ
jgi:hypothetical protein